MSAGTKIVVLRGLVAELLLFVGHKPSCTVVELGTSAGYCDCGLRSLKQRLERNGFSSG